MLTPIAHTTVDIPTYQVDDLILRAPTFSDLDLYAEFCASDRSKGVGGPYTREQAESRLETLVGHCRLRGYGRWIMADATTDTPMGVVGIMMTEDWPAPELAWTVFGNAEGKSVAHRAALFARRYAYEVLGWSTIISCIVPENTRSAALAKRLGAVYEYDYAHKTIGTLNVWRHLPPGAIT